MMPVTLARAEAMPQQPSVVDHHGAERHRVSVERGAVDAGIRPTERVRDRCTDTPQGPWHPTERRRRWCPTGSSTQNRPSNTRRMPVNVWSVVSAAFAEPAASSRLAPATARMRLSVIRSLRKLISTGRGAGCLGARIERANRQKRLCFRGFNAPSGRWRQRTVRKAESDSNRPGLRPKWRWRRRLSALAPGRHRLSRPMKTNPTQGAPAVA